jgi:hypothetical protein
LNAEVSLTYNFSLPQTATVFSTTLLNTDSAI